ncbi:ATP-binding protein [Paenibacillus eucommiae]|uniref:histidine kinase n=1 Tax=Paenibacillus eucommiae TaxID=1355755 RepID=A0ABS4IVF3_9BACL|nr:ATP-binding protein [Paenibacillus eucommiae]MBP1991572.1 sensor histidine kinase YesM [Paenibacillus eucommiae]
MLSNGAGRDLTFFVEIYTIMMIKRKIFFTIGVFFLLLTSVRLLWIMLPALPDHPQAVQGQLDLRNWDFTKESAIPLNGQWEFYPHLFLMPNSGHPAPIPDERELIQVPGKWNNSLSPEKNSTFGYGSYRIRMLIQPEAKQIYSIRVPSVPSSSELYVNGQLLAKSGQPASSANLYTPRNVPYTVSFTTDRNEIEIILHVANYDDRIMGGIVWPIKFGSERAISKTVSFSTGSQMAVFLILLMHSLYAFFLYFLGSRQKALLYFSLLINCAIITLLIDDDRLLLTWLPISFEWCLKLYYLSFLGVALFIFKYTCLLLPQYANLKGLRAYTALAAVYSIIVLFTPVKYVMLTDAIHTLFVLIPFFIVPVLSFRAVLKGNEDAIYLLLGMTGITTNVVWGAIKNTGWMEMGFYPLDIIACFVALALFWFKRYLRSSAQTAELAGQLLEADKRKDDFLLNTSHELRNPLHGMMSIAQTIISSDNRYDEDTNRKNMELLISVGRRMSYMLNDLVDLTRLKESRIQLHVAPLRLQTVASGVIDMIRFMTGDKSVRLINSVPAAFPPVMADENRLIQILFNLLHNAVKFTHEGTITIEAQIKDGIAVILITDTGTGIDEKTKLRIFEPYDQGNLDRTLSASGLGLGLSISKQLVELHQGTITVTSTPGQGSVFAFTLPVSDAPLQQEAAVPALLSQTYSEMAVSLASMSSLTPTSSKPSSILAADNPSILIVDDDPLNLSILVNVLSLERYDIVKANSGREALSLLDSRAWDLIITDVMMPQMSGYELTRAIRERFPVTELPILLLTARNRPEDIDTGFVAGANDYVIKPVDAVELKSRVRALTGIKKSIRERLRMEAAWLQAQIQPHFLYNTLNSIAALSEIDTTRMRALLDAFAEYLRSSFDFLNSDQVVPLEHELNLVRSYLYIEKERFEERLQVTWEVNESLLLQLRLLPLSIQPLVENAVRHGILMRIQGGTIHIRITDFEDYAEISVKDDGVGMDELTIRHLLDSRRSNRKSGIGLRNTDQRLKQLYGKGLQIESSPDKGTTVTFMVKKLEP